LTHLTTSTMYTCGLSIGINVLPGFWHIIWACGLFISAANGRDFTIVFLSWWCGLCDLMHVSSFVYFKKICACVCVCLRQWAGNEDNGWASWYIHRGECVAGTWWCPQVSLRLTVLLSLSSFGGGGPPGVVFFTESGNFQRVATFALFREIGASRFFGGEVGNGHLVLSMDGSICFVFGAGRFCFLGLGSYGGTGHVACCCRGCGIWSGSCCGGDGESFGGNQGHVIKFLNDYDFFRRSRSVWFFWRGGSIWSVFLERVGSVNLPNVFQMLCGWHQDFGPGILAENLSALLLDYHWTWWKRKISQQLDLSCSCIRRALETFLLRQWVHIVVLTPPL